jgi:hypothetical protein
MIHRVDIDFLRLRRADTLPLRAMEERASVPTKYPNAKHVNTINKIPNNANVSAMPSMLNLTWLNVSMNPMKNKTAIPIVPAIPLIFFLFNSSIMIPSR